MAYPVGQNPFAQPSPSRSHGDDGGRRHPVGGNPFKALTPYDDDAFGKVFQRIHNIFSLYLMLMGEVEQTVTKGNVDYSRYGQLSTKDEENRLSEKIDKHNRDLLSLQEELDVLRTDNVPPKDSTPLDPLIGTALLLLSKCGKNAADTSFSRSNRAVIWHFHGPKKVFRSLIEEFLACARQFCANSSNYVGLRNEEFTRVKLENAERGI